MAARIGKSFQIARFKQTGQYAEHNQTDLNFVRVQRPKGYHIARSQMRHSVVKQHKQQIAQQYTGTRNHQLNQAQAFKQHFARHQQRAAQQPA